MRCFLEQSHEFLSSRQTRSSKSSPGLLTALKRMRICIGPVVIGLGRFVEKISPFLDVCCLSLCLFRVSPGAQHHIELGPIERIVPGVAGRWFEYAVSIGVCGPARLAEGRIACPF